MYQSNRMHDAVVSKLIAASRGSPCDSMASCCLVISCGVSVYTVVPVTVTSVSANGLGISHSFTMFSNTIQYFASCYPLKLLVQPANVNVTKCD